jgi:hypothetical protein
MNLEDDVTVDQPHLIDSDEGTYRDLPNNEAEARKLIESIRICEQRHILASTTRTYYPIELRTARHCGGIIL